MFETILALVSSSGIASLLTWLVTRKKQNAEATHTELENVEKAVAIWRQIATDLSGKLDEVSKRLEAVTTELYNLRDENKGLKKQMEKLSKTISHT